MYMEDHSVVFHENDDRIVSCSNKTHEYARLLNILKSNHKYEELNIENINYNICSLIYIIDDNTGILELFQILLELDKIKRFITKYIIILSPMNIKYNFIDNFIEELNVNCKVIHVKYSFIFDKITTLLHKYGKMDEKTDVIIDKFIPTCRIKDIYNMISHIISNIENISNKTTYMLNNPIIEAKNLFDLFSIHYNKNLLCKVKTENTYFSTRIPMTKAFLKDLLHF